MGEQQRRMHYSKDMKRQAIFKVEIILIVKRLSLHRQLFHPDNDIRLTMILTQKFKHDDCWLSLLSSYRSMSKQFFCADFLPSYLMRTHPLNSQFIRLTGYNSTFEPELAEPYVLGFASILSTDFGTCAIPLPSVPIFRSEDTTSFSRCEDDLEVPSHRQSTFRSYI